MNLPWLSRYGYTLPWNNVNHISCLNRARTFLKFDYLINRIEIDTQRMHARRIGLQNHFEARESTYASKLYSLKCRL